jgi:hypothetical protein
MALHLDKILIYREGVRTNDKFLLISIVAISFIRD